MEPSHFKTVLKLKPVHIENPLFSIKSDSIVIQDLAEFKFDRIFENDSTNALSFDFLKPFFSLCFKGVNLTVLAYGEKHSGKTFTIFGNQFAPGLAQLTLGHLFSLGFRESFTISCSMLAVSNDRLIDLLQENYEKPRLKIKKDVKNTIFVENLAEIIAEKEEDCLFLLKKGLRVKRGLKNPVDLIFQLSIESLKADNKGLIYSSRVNFVDLSNEKSRNLQSLNSVLTCLSNNVSVPYRDSNLTKILSDTLNPVSNTVIFSTFTDLNPYSLDVLSLISSCRQIQVFPKKNEFVPTGFHVLKKLHSEISKLKNKLKAKKGGKSLTDEVNLMKKETEKLKDILNEQTTVQEVEELIKHNKLLKCQLEDLVGRPTADNDVELPDSVVMLQQALVLTEDMIKKRKLVLADQEMKEKLRIQGRCTICTLKVPCKHSSATSTSVTSPNRKVNSSQEFFNPRQKNRPLTPGLNEKFIQRTERKIKVLSQIEAYHEQKVLKELERVENEKKTILEIEKKKAKDEEKRKKYLMKNKEKLKVYKIFKEKKAESERKLVKKMKVKGKDRTPVRGISNYEEKRKSISDILRAQSKFFKVRHVRASSVSYIESDYESFSPLKK
jgi:hypothetical protein